MHNFISNKMSFKGSQRSTTLYKRATNKVIGNRAAFLKRWDVLFVI